MRSYGDKRIRLKDDGEYLRRTWSAVFGQCEIETKKAGLGKKQLNLLALYSD